MAKKIMIQGTMSNAGKSILTAGLLRVLKQDGYRCAPFKSQNMALNSGITSEGLEMGRAQVMQAEAAGIEPKACMNPILLKPMGDTTSQVIVKGRPVGNMKAAEYYTKKEELIPRVLEAWHELEEEADVIVIEGAGSPAEINLKENDIANMGMARLVNAPVLLAGDIDRGGVFAQLAGTWLLLDEEERSFLKGMLINKFRGDRSILEPGIELFARYCPVPVLGVIPYMHLDIDEEDSLAARLEGSGKGGRVRIAVIRLPHISNFTDFAPLERIPDVSVRYVRMRQELGRPDLVILPGTKNTMGDLSWLKESGLAGDITALHADGVPVFGVCGGYQMLGRRLSDPDHTEAGGETDGLGLLPVETVFAGEKTMTQVRGRINGLRGYFAGLSGAEAAGYEIHMGVSRQADGTEFSSVTRFEEREQHADGCVQDHAAGTYLHGIFDSADFTGRFLAPLFAAKGLGEPDLSAQKLSAYKEEQYDRLADGIRASCDLEGIYRIIGL